MYKDNEKKRQTELLKSNPELFEYDCGNGKYINHINYPFVLNNGALNLYRSIRIEAIDYFKKYKISWHDGKNNLPSGHLLDSQIACVNHLFMIKSNKEAATKILQNIDSEIEEAEVIDDDYVQFEFVGKNGIEGENSIRGMVCTSVDACMIGKRKNGTNRLFLIEWKYTENYGKKALEQCNKRINTYNHLIENENSPFKKEYRNSDIYYHEPFYQMMRQTLLGEVFIKNKEYNCEEYKLVHVIPSENKSLLNNVTSDGFSGEDICSAWKKALINEESYICVSPKELLQPLICDEEFKDEIEYLKKRYW